jgi:hypothetical protein
MAGTEEVLVEGGRDWVAGARWRKSAGLFGIAFNAIFKILSEVVPINLEVLTRG